MEYRTVSGTEPLRQGDVLEAVEAAPIWSRHLFVLTADCDFAHSKHQGRVTCIPFLTAEEYLLELHLPRLRERLLKKPITEFRSALAKINGPEITDDRLRQWVLEEPIEAIIATLEVSGSIADDLEIALESMRHLLQPCSSLDAAVKALIEAQMASASPPSRANATKKVRAAVRDAYVQPPGDAIFISAFAPANDSGYFAYFRHLEQVWEERIAVTPGLRSVDYRRVARLKDRYTHALVQRFAMVFMPIGLPDEYEEMRDVHSELIGDGLS